MGNSKYRIKTATQKFDGISVEIKPEEIEPLMYYFSKQVKELMDSAGNMDMNTYLLEVLRMQYRFIRINPFQMANGRTVRTIVNLLLMQKGMMAIFRKEKRKEYIKYINKANRVIKLKEDEYINKLKEDNEESRKIEDKFLSINNVPFLLVTG